MEISSCELKLLAVKDPNTGSFELPRTVLLNS
jgi:hypothetical protein